jgi:hypothetical protein
MLKSIPLTVVEFLRFGCGGFFFVGVSFYAGLHFLMRHKSQILPTFVFLATSACLQCDFPHPPA